jgi:hypothetical protein
MLADYPEDSAARGSLAAVLEHQGRFADGMAEMVTGEILSGGGHPTISSWDGRPLGTASLLVTCTAGIGDILQMIRYALPLRRAEPQARLVLWCRPEVASAARLMRLFDDVVATQTIEDSIFDWEISLMRLRLRHHLTSDASLGEKPYLKCEPATVEPMRRRLNDLDGGDRQGPAPLRIGLRWSGAPHAYDARRSIPHAQLAPLFTLPHITWVALLESGHREIPALHDGSLPLADVSGHLHDLGDTAALICALDLIISVDTSTAHLAGALGVPCWMLARPDCDPRWGLVGDQSTLYESVRVFRHPGLTLDWDHVVRACVEALAGYR